MWLKKTSIITISCIVLAFMFYINFDDIRIYSEVFSLQRKLNSSEKAIILEKIEEPIKIRPFPGGKNLTIEDEYKQRLHRIRWYCNEYKKNSQFWDRVSLPSLSRFNAHIKLNNRYKLLYYETPKCGSSSWVYYFWKKIHGTKHGYTPKRPPPTDRDKLIRWWKNLVSHGYLMFTFVRHPFFRLASNYKDKFLGNQEKWGMDKVNRRLIKKYRKEEPKNSFYKNRCTFQEYVWALLAREPLSDREAPISTFTFPCELNYHFIGKVENFVQEGRYVLKKQKAPYMVGVKNTSGSKKDIRKYFSQITKEELLSLYEIYRTDFEMFNYDFKEFLKYVKK